MTCKPAWRGFAATRGHGQKRVSNRVGRPCSSRKGVLRVVCAGSTQLPPPRPAPKPSSSSNGRPGWIGAYSPEARKRRVARFHGKRARRVWTKRVKYDVRKNFAETRLRVKGRFVKKEEEDLLKDLVGVV